MTLVGKGQGGHNLKVANCNPKAAALQRESLGSVLGGVQGDKWNTIITRSINSAWINPGFHFLAWE